MSKAKYITCHPVRLNGTLYEDGAEIEPDEDDAAILLELEAIEPQDDFDPEPEGDTEETDDSQLEPAAEPAQEAAKAEEEAAAKEPAKVESKVKAPAAKPAKKDAGK